MTKKIDWEVLECRVRTIASYIWNATAKAEFIHGVKCDSVQRLEADQWVLIEITRSGTLTKLREDLAKFAAVKPALMAEGIFAKCLFICADTPSDGLVQTAKGHKVEALSVADFEKKFFDYGKYRYVRASRPFGSAVDPISGEKDSHPYVKVSYEELHGRNSYEIGDLHRLLTGGARIVLLGNYGTGKSRCFQELFAEFDELDTPNNKYAIAVDLRENWGLRRANEVIRRHFEDLGLPDASASIIKILPKDNLVFMLDGFDEIASQVWSDDPTRLEEIRAQSLSGVKDLIRNSRGGILISGREHYFNTEEEMFRVLGLDPGGTIVIRCADEFSEAQMEEYLRVYSPGMLLPKWLPRRPLVSKILSALGPDELAELFSESGEVDFWHKLLDAICIREARIHVSLDPDTIRSVLLELAQLSRMKRNNVGPMTLTEINGAFEKVVGRPPRDEASAMLQRLPIMGRVDSGSSDRLFLDTYILDGLRATATIELVMLGGTPAVLNDVWHHPLSDFGHSLLAYHIASTSSSSLYLRLLKQAANSSNRVLAGDILTALLSLEDAQFDFENLELSESHIGSVNFADTNVSNLTLKGCIIDELHASPKASDSIHVEDCLIGTLRGLSRTDELPESYRNCEVENFDALTNVSKIKEAGLSSEQQVFVTIIHKTFFQPGSGRKEDALLRGLGSASDQRAASKILSFLIEEGVLDKFPGKQGTVYTPVRRHTRRLGKILSLLRHSSDPLWLKLRSDR